MPSWTEKVYHGAAYYPELWRDKVDEDIRLMREAGMDLVRVGEFAWSSFEPEEGRYDLDWLREVLDKCHAAGIDVVLCTPTPTPPRWLTVKYPEVLRVDIDGQPFEHGSRQHVSHVSARYREFSRKITEKLASEFGKHPAVVAWQTDNEFLCHVDGDFGPETEHAWHEWLKDKYGTIENLNDIWGTYIWSEDYRSFGQVPMARKTPFGGGAGTFRGQHHCSLAKDWGHFISETVAAFQREQVEIIRKHSDAPITHNQIADDRVFGEDVFADLDFTATDIYAPHENTWGVQYKLDWLRALKRRNDGTYEPYMILETSPSHNGSTQTGHDTHPDGFLRAEAALHMAMGGRAFCYWLWRQQKSGAEMCHGSVVTSWGTPSVGWRNVRQVTELFEAAGELFTELPPAPAEIAMHESKHTRAHMTRSEKLWGDVKGMGTVVQQCYRAMLEVGLWRDVCFDSADFSPYKAVVSPFQSVLTGEFIDKMAAFVRDGGTWVAGPMSGCRTEYGTVHTDAGLGRLDELAGVRTLHPFGTTPQHALLAGDPIDVGWYCYALEPQADDCEVIGEYAEGPAAGSAWAVRRKLGKGQVVLFAAHAPDEYARMLSVALEGVDMPRYQASWGTSVVPRADGDKRGYVLVNWDGRGGTATLPEAGKDLLTGKKLPAGKLELGPFDVYAVMCQ
ncbi:MAG: beta-galactosidase [Phycisphaerae bacterium]